MRQAVIGTNYGLFTDAYIRRSATMSLCRYGMHEQDAEIAETSEQHMNTI